MKTQYDKSDWGNAELFCGLFGNNFRYCTARRHWLIWRTHWWDRCEEAEVIEKLVEATRERERRSVMLDEKQQAAERHWAGKSRQERALRSALTLAKGMDPIRTEDAPWDQDFDLLGVKNGVVDLRTGELRKGRREDMITRHIEYPIEPGEPTLWIENFNNMFDFEEGVADFVWKSLGYSITGHRNEQCLWLLSGEGANGKSTFFDALVALLGPYAYAMPFTTIDKMAKTNISNEVADLFGYRFVVASEAQEGDSRFNEGRLKQLTGDRFITARNLYERNKMFVPQCHFWVAFNNAPTVMDDTHGFWRRIRRIHMKKQFPIGPDFFPELVAEFPRILDWLVKGCVRWRIERAANRNSGLQIPLYVSESTQSYRDDNDRLKSWLDDRIVPTATLYHLPKRQAYHDFKTYCIEEGDTKPISHKLFTQRMLRKGFKDERNAEHRYWLNIRLKDRTDDGLDFYVDTDSKN